ncbi:MAG: S-layer homology domain-containing protein [Synergistaceae bacterium]|nr:S-layer homology domain-containing protein [Synergistaceae bacterium]
MKKVAALLAIVAVAALAAPALSETNPFMDVPMNHWAYDAIGQLAAHGILSGYPDGLYKGKQPTTRYEMASALARALAVVDMTKASKQDVEMLKRLVVEFKDELEALGVRVDELDERVSVLENRLGGWHIHGALVLDVMNESANNAADKDGDGDVKFDNARLFFERTFGENDEFFFRARLRNDGGDNDGFQNSNGNSAYFDRYYVTMPFFFDSRMTVGRFLYDIDTAYRPSVAETGSWTGGDSVLTDTSEIGFAFEKSFGLGNFLAYFSHSNRMPSNFVAYDDSLTWDANGNVVQRRPHGVNRRAWAMLLAGNLQFTEQIGLDIGGQAFFGDNAETPVDPHTTAGDLSFNNLWTVFAGLRFNFNDSIALKASFYHQAIDSEITDATGGLHWRDWGYGLVDANGGVIDDANHWRAIIDVKQEALKYTSLWLEYGQYDAGFFVPQGISTVFPSEASVITDQYSFGSSVAQDLKYWRIVLGQEWNEKWATHIFYYGYNAENGKVVNGRAEDAKPFEVGLGVQYKLNDATTMGLNYVHADNDQEQNNKDNIIRFRTSVNF